MDNITQRALDIGMIQIPYEIENFVDIIKSKVKITGGIILEIGTKYGGTTHFLAEHFPKAKIISIDLPRKSPFNETVKNRNRWFKAYFGDRVEFLVADSQKEETRNIVLNIVNNYGIDCLFIDGDHTYEGVKQDFINWLPAMVSGSIIGFHDIVDSENHRKQNCYVAKFWNELKNNKQYYHGELIENKNQDWAGIGYLFV